MRGIEALVVLPVAALHLPIMPGGIGTDHFMLYPMFLQTFLEKGWFIPMGREAVGELCPIVGLDTFNRAGKGFYKVFHKLCGRIGTVFLKGFYKTPSGILIDSCVLEEMFPNNLAVFQAGRGDEFDIDLDALSWMIHLFIGFRDILWIWRMNGHDALFSKESVKAGDGPGIAALPELNPENDQAGIGVAPAQVLDEPDLLGSMLVGMMVRASGAVAQRVPGAVIAA